MKKRLLSAVIMIIIFVPLLLLGDIYYTVFGGIVGLISLWEIMKLEKNIPSVMKIISYFACLFLILYNYKYLSFDVYNMTIIVGLILLYTFSVIIYHQIDKYTYKDGLWLLIIVFLMGIIFNGFIKIRLLGWEIVLYCFLVSAMTDTFAYLGGTMFGKHKLIPSISPNKTFEGSIIGSLMGTIIGSVFFYLVVAASKPLWEIILLTFVLTIVSQMGDLFFSSVKRHYKVKDFSNIIPGHGGVLDRLDSTLFVILAFLMYISI